MFRIVLIAFSMGVSLPLMVSAQDSVEIAKQAATRHAWEEWLTRGKPSESAILKESNEWRPEGYKLSAEQLDSMVDVTTIDSIYALVYLDRDLTTIFKNTHLYYCRELSASRMVHARGWKGYIAVHKDSAIVLDYWRHDSADIQKGDLFYETKLVNKLIELEGEREYTPGELFEMIKLIVAMRERRGWGGYPKSITTIGEVFPIILSSYRMRDLLLDDTTGQPPSEAAIYEHFKDVNWENLRKIDSLMQNRSLIEEHWSIRFFYLMYRGLSKSDRPIIYVKMIIPKFINNQIVITSETDLGDIEKMEYNLNSIGKTFSY